MENRRISSEVIMPDTRAKMILFAIAIASLLAIAGLMFTDKQVEIDNEIRGSVWPVVYKTIWLSKEDVMKKPALKRRQRRHYGFDAEKWYRINRKDIVLDRVIKNYGRVIKMVSERVGIDWRYPIAIAVVESNGRREDVNKIGGNDERCAFQVMDGTAKDVEKRFKVNFDKGGLSNPWNCAYAGAGTLRIYFDEFRDMSIVFVAYNRGNTKVRGILAQGINPKETSFYDDKVEHIKKQIS